MTTAPTTHASDDLAPAATPPDTARVTIVMAFRERWSLTPMALEAIVARTPPPFRLWFLDTGMPKPLMAWMRAFAQRHPLEILPMPANLWPNQARGLAAPRIDTPYAVFIDNDVVVQPGWLEALVACADETGAGIVGPLYLWGEDEGSDLIHMAGGELSVRREGERFVLGERHRLINRRLADLPAPPRRERCGFAEYHCMLMRRELVRAPGTFDPGIVSVHEHIHASLMARQQGLETWTEPAARVMYLARTPWRIGEVPYLRHRWSRAAAESSLQRFAARWNVIDDERSFAPVRDFVRRHVDAVDPVRLDLQDPERARAPMVRRDLEQTPAGLAALAQARGYAPEEIALMLRACWRAMRLFDGGYRPCGRPFLNHAVGTASVLVHYGFSLRMVLAGLLHAAYTHGRAPDGPGGDRGVLRARIDALLGGESAPLTRTVHAYTLRHLRYPEILRQRDTPGSIGTQDAELLLLEAANDIDMHLSLEVAATGRTDTPDGPLLKTIAQVCAVVGVPGMGATLAAVRREQATAPRVAFYQGAGSFRIEGDRAGSMLTGSQPPATAETVAAVGAVTASR